MNASLDTTELEKYQQNLEKLSSSKEGMYQFFEWATKQIAARFLDRVIKRTPAEKNQTIKYRMAKGRIGEKEIKGGALRRGWVGGRDISEDNLTEAINGHLKEVNIIKYGRIYQLTISNAVEYAPYVEYGHKQKVGKFVPYIGKEVNGVRQGAPLKEGAVKGEFMMKKSADEINRMAPGLAEKLIMEYLKKNF